MGVGLHTMKKSYIIPSTTVFQLSSRDAILGSLSTQSATFYDEDATGAALVKGRTQHYDVWEDDWSEENDE